MSKSEYSIAIRLVLSANHYTSMIFDQHADSRTTVQSYELVGLFRTFFLQLCARLIRSAAPAWAIDSGLGASLGAIALEMIQILAQVRREDKFFHGNFSAICEEVPEIKIVER
jgi:hypothetical protein